MVHMCAMNKHKKAQSAGIKNTVKLIGECWWVAAPQINGLATLDSRYPTMELFFDAPPHPAQTRPLQHFIKRSVALKCHASNLHKWSCFRSESWRTESVEWTTMNRIHGEKYLSIWQPVSAYPSAAHVGKQLLASGGWPGKRHQPIAVGRKQTKESNRSNNFRVSRNYTAEKVYIFNVPFKTSLNVQHKK